MYLLVAAAREWLGGVAAFQTVVSPEHDWVYQTVSHFPTCGLIKAIGDGPLSLIQQLKSENVKLEVVDAHGAWVTPEIVDLHSHISVESAPKLNATMKLALSFVFAAIALVQVTAAAPVIDGRAIGLFERLVAEGSPDVEEIEKRALKLFADRAAEGSPDAEAKTVTGFGPVCLAKKLGLGCFRKGMYSFASGWVSRRDADVLEAERDEAISAAPEKVAIEVSAKHTTAVVIAYLMQKTPFVSPITGGRKTVAGQPRIG
ncbi:uncharacterized protein EDB91DRAFT_1295475 [Suillus paluster]|uniref:uncharacterized protein n=1 Tax=Suillus paluster TaxID=48578 RepID=UPI001B880CEA|nr:uncharacterized protein EDB91DRAFT_1295475 [Suillus paluster]KAG1735280.1 hypothetical protein EDB91DRAFT_1295475 [Suillus paluster]